MVYATGAAWQKGTEAVVLSINAGNLKETVRGESGETAIEVLYRSKFTDKGKGSLEVTARDASGKTAVSQRFGVPPDGGEKKALVALRWDENTRWPIRVKSRLVVEDRRRTVSDEKTVSLRAVEEAPVKDQAWAAAFREAHDRVQARLEALIPLVKEMSDDGAPVEDVAEWIASLYARLEKAATIDEILVVEKEIDGVDDRIEVIIREFYRQ